MVHTDTLAQPVGLRVRALRLIGRYSLDIRLDHHDRFFILQGENTSGKTTFIKLIIFGLGGDIPQFIPEVRQCRSVLLEISIGGELYTFERYISNPSLIYVCEGGLDLFSESESITWSIDGRVTPDIFQDFFMDKLGLRDRQVIKRGTSDVSRLDWNQLLGLVYVDQDTPASVIYWTLNESEPREIKRKRVEAVFDLKLDQIDDLEVARSKLGRAESLKGKELAGVNRVLGDLGLSLETGLLQLTMEIDRNHAERAKTSEALTQLKTEMRNKSSHLDQLRLGIANLTDSLTQVENETVLTLSRMQDYQRLLNELRVEEHRVASATVISNALSGLTVDTCPYCLKEVNSTPASRDTCPVCHQHIENDEQPLEMEHHLESIADKTKDITAVLDHEEKHMAELVSARKLLVAQKTDHERHLNEGTASMIAPFLSELEDRYHYIQALEREADDLRSKLRAYEQIKSYEDELTDIRSQLRQLNSTLRALKELVQKQLPRYLSIMTEALQAFLADGVLPQTHKVEIHNKLFIPLLDDREIGALDSASAKVIARLGFFYSLLTLAVQTEVKHPRLLLLDSPRDKDLDQRKFDLIVSKFVRLVENAQVDCQVIMTTSEITEHLEPFVFLKTHAAPGGYLLNQGSKET